MPDYLGCYLIAIAIGKFMLRLQGMLQKQVELLLSNRQRALLCALVLTVFPFAAWFSAILIALVTLRKGWREGALLLLPAMGAYFGCSVFFTSTMVATINTLTLYLPCYVAACTLRVSMSWQAVSAVFFLQISLTAWIIQWLTPDFVMTQYLYLKAMLQDSQSESAISNLLRDGRGFSQTMLASYVFGIQMLSVAFSALSALMVARSMQSKLYNPGGFKQEMIGFRASKLGLFILMVLIIAALQKNRMGMMLLPAPVMYFLLSGISLSAYVLMKKNSRLTLIVLILPLVFLPFVMVPIYGMLGLLDSLFNLRVSTLKYKKRG